MAQILLIKKESLSVADNREIDDIVGIFDDGHIFSDNEKDIFRIEKVETSKEILSLSQPIVREAFRSKTNEWTIEEPETTRVWKDGTDYKEIRVEPAFPTRYEHGTVKENFSRHPENHTVLISEKLEAME